MRNWSQRVPTSVETPEVSTKTARDAVSLAFLAGAGLFSVGADFPHSGLLLSIAAVIVFWQGARPAPEAERHSTDRAALIAIIVLTLSFCYHLAAPLVDATVLAHGSYYRSGVAFLVGLVAVLYLPHVLSRRRATWVVASAAAIVALLALESSLVLTAGVPFDRPNAVAGVCAVGAVAAVADIDISRRSRSIAPLAIVTTAILLSQARAGITAAIIGIGLWIVYRHYGAEAMIGAAVTGGLTGVIGIVGTSAPIHTWSPLSGFGNRIEIWQATVVEIVRHPQGTGFGPSARYVDLPRGPTAPHNGYLEMALVFGVPAGLSYLALLASGITSGLRRLSDPTTAAFVCLVAAALVTQTFYSTPLFALRGSGIYAALAIGYLVAGGDNE